MEVTCPVCGYGKVPTSTATEDLEGYKVLIDDLAIKRGWNRKWTDLALRLNIEVGELEQAILRNESDDRIKDEFADVMHFLLQLMSVTSKSDKTLDTALSDKIISNWKNPKKVLNDDGSVRMG